jgi:hypothetical protein
MKHTLSIKWNISRKTSRDWKKVLPKLELEVRETKLTTHPGSKMKGTHLIPFINNEIQKAQIQCKPLTYGNIAQKLFLQEPTFLNTEDEPGNEKQMARWYDWVRRAVKCEGFVIRSATHVVQNALSNAELTADFMSWYCYAVHTYQVSLSNSYYNKYLLCKRSDLTASSTWTKKIFSLMTYIARRTITNRGIQTVNITLPKLKHGGRASVNLCVGMDGYKLSPFVIMKGKPNGRIKKKDLPELNLRCKSEVIFTFQDNAWCDEEAMLQWIEEVWKPLTILKKPRITMLILDQFTVQKTNSVLSAIGKLGTVVIHLPPGETSKLQILDVGINKPFKLYCQQGL